MKKLTILLVAMLFTVGMAFAQNNDVYVAQTGNNHIADIEQIGNTNEVTLTQISNASGSSVADIDQNGSTNFVSLEQTGNNSANIDQDGDHTVKGFYDQWNSSNPSAIQINTGGAQNTLDITQESLWNQVYVNQEGGGNDIDVYQGGGNSNVARFLQDGDGNTIDVSLAGGSINRVDIQQLGVGGHTANVDIVGSANNFTSAGYSYIYQDGEGHTSDVMITGDANYYNIYQTGVSQTANVNVNGSSNTALITQGN